ncbi:homeobox-DDT domain protein RLT2-like isoform X2 [Ipomoea triloba]|uniref:homeobox-DDT domain protein RLT2-like isoform X2 n=1 Tax=Ipomoea triloba TaxID=35885 RepID=UPI00125E96EA|nr:homeobox-DDT domain protein RLT2-like isoform X2 [Ipomoea triloba]
MEIGGGSGRGFDRNDNLKMKATAQIDVLEHYYAVERYPSPDLMEELSAKLGLSDQQVNVWFQCRRQKDRDRIAIGIPLHKVASTMPMASLIAVGEVWGKPVPGSPYGRLMVQQPGVRVPSYGNEGLSTRRYDQFPWTIQHSRAVAAVEKQLGGHFIDNGPVLGFNFDPLPPGAFHTPIEPAVHYKQGGQSHRAELHGGPIQAANQTSLQYQFTQGESSSAAAAYGPRVPPGYYSSPAEAQTIAIALSGGSSYVHGTQLPISGLLRPQGIQSSISQSLGAHVVPQSSSRLNMRVDAIFGGCSTTGEENPLMPSGTQAIGDNRLLARNWKVWRFLICLADALSLSPFTIDEFVHDTVHIMLLRSIIKDIEGAANSGGGNPRIVEEAYARGFNTSSWQRHLNPLTWPEILRQFALSAGFGPVLKKRNIEPASSSDESKGDDDTDTSASSPNEVAAENAASATVATFSIPGNTVNEKSDSEEWVERIMEEEYSDLSVEERLDAFVALISVATEGKSIRVVLEERIEAASASTRRQSNISRSLGAHVVPQSSSLLNRRVDANFGGCSITGEENPLMPSGTQAIRGNRLLARNWKISVVNSRPSLST